MALQNNGHRTGDSPNSQWIKGPIIAPSQQGPQKVRADLGASKLNQDTTHLKIIELSWTGQQHDVNPLYPTMQALSLLLKASVD